MTNVFSGVDAKKYILETTGTGLKNLTNADVLSL